MFRTWSFFRDHYTFLNLKKLGIHRKGLHTVHRIRINELNGPLQTWSFQIRSFRIRSFQIRSFRTRYSTTRGSIFTNSALLNSDLLLGFKFFYGQCSIFFFCRGTLDVFRVLSDLFQQKHSKQLKIKSNDRWSTLVRSKNEFVDT